MRTPRAASTARRAARGQALILTVLLMLFVTVAVFLTFAIGTRARRKIQLQALADSTAYSLAVAEARAFNFYAWSNRAIVAHNISILSVHAHTSYITFYEDALAATANTFMLLSEKTASPTKELLAEVANSYLNSDFNLEGKPCTWVKEKKGGENSGGEKCVVDSDCTGKSFCNIEGNEVRGARWYHKEWHGKTSSNTCYRLVEGSRDHFAKTELLRAHQLGVQSQLRLMMTGASNDVTPVADEPLLGASTQKEVMYDSLEGDILDLPQQSLAQHLVSLTDTRLTAEKSAGDRSLWYYQRAVDDGLRGNLHKDYDEILAATRFPSFITQRGFKEDNNWKRLLIKAIAAVGEPLSRDPLVQIVNEGTTRMLKISSAAEDPGSYNNRPGPLMDLWPPLYSKMPAPLPGEPPRPAYQLPQSGQELSKDTHQRGHDPAGLGDSDGIAAEDHGWAVVRYGTMVERTEIDPGRNGVWGDPHDWRGNPDHSVEGDRFTHSLHIFHADQMLVPAHGSDLGQCNDFRCEQSQRGVYRGHMRFKNSSDEDVLWNMPRTMTLITRPMNDPERWPWDFDFQAEIPSPIQFTTMNSQADAESANTMAAFAGGLVYFHKPDGEEYREPPNFWNPFWRAKLHPMRADDAVNVTTTGHPATYRILLQLDRWRAVNY
jgi:hypothetical protein